jgi:rhomboid protease GluP
MRKNRPDAVKLVFVPVLITAIIFLTIFTLIHWLIIEMYTITDEHEMISFFLPFPFALIIILMFLRRSIGLLHLNNVRGRWAFYYFAMLVIGLPAMFAQRYLLTAAGKLTVLDNIEQYEHEPPTKYYAIRDFYIYKDQKVVFEDEYLSGKSNRNLNLDIYIAAPILTSAADTPTAQKGYWLCQRQGITLDKYKPDGYQRETALKNFRANTLQHFEGSGDHHIHYWKVLPKGSERDKFESTIAGTRMHDTDITMLSPEEGPYEKRNGNRGWWALGSFAIAMVTWLLMVIWCGINMSNANLQRK